MDGIDRRRLNTSRFGPRSVCCASGYDGRTGWTHCTPSKVQRYHRRVEGQADVLDERLRTAGVDHYWDQSGGLHVHCDEGRLWELLSGDPSTWGKAEEVGYETEWVSVTDIGENLDPHRSASAVLAELRRAGLLERRGGKDTPTTGAEGLYEERPAEPTGRFPSKPGAVQRRWAFSVLQQLRGF